MPLSAHDANEATADQAILDLAQFTSLDDFLGDADALAWGGDEDELLLQDVLMQSLCTSAEQQLPNDRTEHSQPVQQPQPHKEEPCPSSQNQLDLSRNNPVVDPLYLIDSEMLASALMFAKIPPVNPSLIDDCQPLLQIPELQLPELQIQLPELQIQDALHEADLGCNWTDDDVQFQATLLESCQQELPTTQAATSQEASEFQGTASDLEFMTDMGGFDAVFDLEQDELLLMQEALLDSIVLNDNTGSAVGATGMPGDLPSITESNACLCNAGPDRSAPAPASASVAIAETHVDVAPVHQASAGLSSSHSSSVPLFEQLEDVSMAVELPASLDSEDQVMTCCSSQLPDHERWSKELLTMPVLQFNRFIRSNRLGADELRDLRKARRRLKNRGYSKAHRDRYRDSHLGPADSLETSPSYAMDLDDSGVAAGSQNTKRSLVTTSPTGPPSLMPTKPTSSTLSSSRTASSTTPGATAGTLVAREKQLVDVNNKLRTELTQLEKDLSMIQALRAKVLRQLQAKGVQIPESC